MRLKGALTLQGKFIIRHYRNGKLIDEEEITNTITNAGKAKVAGLINEVTSGGFKWIALGDSSTAATANDTALASEITGSGLGRAQATCSRVTTDVSNDTAQLVHTFVATGTVSVKEAGIFDTSTANAGTMLARQTFTAKNLEANDSLEVTYKVKVA